MNLCTAAILALALLAPADPPDCGPNPYSDPPNCGPPGCVCPPNTVMDVGCVIDQATGSLGDTYRFLCTIYHDQAEEDWDSGCAAMQGNYISWEDWLALQASIASALQSNLDGLNATYCQHVRTRCCKTSYAPCPTGGPVVVADVLVRRWRP